MNPSLAIGKFPEFRTQSLHRTPDDSEITAAILTGTAMAAAYSMFERCDPFRAETLPEIA
jgi:hypothetical protein